MLRYQCQLFTVCLMVHCGRGSSDWGYSEKNGPANWKGECKAGLKQSPINIQSENVDIKNLAPINFIHYNHSGLLRVTNNGHTILVNGFAEWGANQPNIEDGGLPFRYKLAQFHFHWSKDDDVGSEHQINGSHYPVELHLVHYKSDLTLEEAMKVPNGLAVVAVLLDVVERERMAAEPPNTSMLSLMTPPTTTINSPLICFNFLWSAKVSMRQLSEDDAVILHVSPKFATVHDHVSFQWSLKIHGTTGRLSGSDEETDEAEEDPQDYVAVELYFADGPVPQVEVRALIGILNSPKDSSNMHVVEERRSHRMDRGRSAEVTDQDRALVSQYIKEHVGKVIHLSLFLKMDAKLFDPYTYLDAISPTPHTSFLTANYNARVNSKVWKRKTRKRSSREESRTISRKDQKYYEERFQEVMDQEREKYDGLRVRAPSSRRSSTITLMEHQSPDDEHIFKKLLISCCSSCERRRSSFYDGKTEDSEEEEEESDDDEEKCFECTESDKEHVHDMLANLYFYKVVLPDMDIVEDFVDFLIDAELNDLPVLKRACERYLCGELNTKKDLLTSLILDLLFISIVFNLPVMKSMTLSELSMRTEELAEPDKLMEQEEYKSLDRRIRSLSDRNLIELIEQVGTFREQRNRAKIVILPDAEPRRVAFT